MIVVKPAFSGRLRIVKRKKSGEVVFDSTMSNDILDAGIEAFFNRTVTSSTSITSYTTMAFAAMRFLFLGTGATEPSPSDNGLESRSGTLPGKEAVGGVGYSYGDTGVSNWGYMPREAYADTENHIYWTECTFEFQYGEGEAEGVWTEVGLADDSTYTNPFSRALIRDENGDPMSLTVLSDEYLSVFYTVRYEDGMGEPQSGVVNVGGVDYQWTARQNPGSSEGGWLAVGGRARNTSYLGLWSENSPFRSINPFQSDILGNEYYPEVFSRSSTFDEVAMTIKQELVFEPTNVDYIVSHLTLGHAGFNRDGALYYVEFSPPIPKKADYRLTIGVDIHIALQGDPVTGVSNTANSSSLDFTWDAYPNTTEYALVLRQAGTVVGTQTVTAPTTTASFTGLTASTEYHLDIQPKTAGRDGARSIHAATTGAA